jgi:phosphoadenosine phosphosulfate reductase
MRCSYLGKLHLHWCDTCHVPVLGGRCGCGANTRQVPVTPPGDIRPAFQADIDHINAIYKDYFGQPLIPEGHLALLNKVPDRDRMEEIVMGGCVVGAIRYIPAENRWEPIPRQHASRYLSPTMRTVIVDDGAASFISDGASVLAPGLIDLDAHIREGDEVFILDTAGQCIGVGRAKTDSATAKTMERGVIVRTRKNVKAEAVPGCATWTDAIRANEEILDRMESEAIRFVRDIAEKNPLPANVSYSGGKDSLATLLVVLKAIGPVPLLFADTGLEFEETYENIERVASTYDLEVIRAGSKEAFWDCFSTDGPPSVDARWCCKVCKLDPVRELIQERWGECLSFIGQRKYESLNRKKSPRVWRNGYVQVQLSAAPIQHWTALHVWLYLFREQAPYNILYTQRIDRIGCYMCPASDLAIFELIKTTHPHLWAFWQERLNGYMNEHDLPPEWEREGSWRRRGDSGL